MDSPATPTDFSPLLSLAPRNESCYTKGDDLAGARRLGRTFGGHLRVEDDDANSPVQRTTTDDDERRPAASLCGGGDSVDGGGGSPPTGDGGEWGGRASTPPCAPNGGDVRRRRRCKRRREAAVRRPATAAVWVARRRHYEARESSGDGAKEIGRLGDAIYRLGLKRSDSNREDLSRKNRGLVGEINSKTNSIPR
uniref:DUF834 domain-containing protein n=1 Tax=Oryza sativa subsp. japonica TaxID=39947 RepID=Q69IV3_ORYSJ|nr:hypothetical protein [Oryza sativa Japonica Group]